MEDGAPEGVRYLDEVFDEVELTEGVEYREAVTVDGTTQQLHLDIYEPAGDTAERRPVVLLMHGGFFVLGNHQDDQWGAGPLYAEAWARKGFVAVSMQYRLRPDMGFFPDVDPADLDGAIVDAYDDSVAAVDWLVANAEALRLDPRAIVANGPSAGGSMAWNLAWVPGSALRPEPSGIAAAVSVAGAPLGATAAGAPFAAASPGDRPVIAFHGTEDAIVGLDLAEVPCAGAAAAGVRCDLVAYEGIGHPGVDPLFFDLVPDIERRAAAFITEMVLAPLGYDVEPPPPGPPPTVPPPGPDPSTPPSTAPPTTERPPAARPPTPRGPHPVGRARPAVPIVAQPTYTG
jgi:dienelactone hydrolase